MLRGIPICLALALLGACNMVVTRDPVFSKADAAGAPAMRPGVWDGEPAANCTVDESQPLADWPACANGFVVLDDHTLGEVRDQNGKPARATADYVLATGRPRVLQLHLTADDPAMPAFYVYGAFEPTKLDDAGRIVAGRSWIVVCGPPPPPSAAQGPNAKPRMGTLHPFDGLKMDSDGTNCAPGSPDALRGAARLSRAQTEPKDISGSHWVRDGTK
jgi:hypothetical protein